MTPVQAASRILWMARAESVKLPTRARAEAAYYVGGPSVDELEQIIRNT